MRLYCLSSIEKVAPTPIITKPYDITAAENLSTGIDEFQTRLKITTALDYYCLTEICIGYKYIENKEIHRKVYVMNIYRHDSGLLTFRMIRGAVSLTKNNDNTVDLKIATKKLYSDDNIQYDLNIRIRCIKLTKEVKYLIKNEEKIYEEYAQRILEFSLDNKKLREAAFDEFEFCLPNKSAPKKLQDKINELNQLITLLCDPNDGCYNNVPNGARYNQKVDCLLLRKQLLTEPKLRDFKEKVKNSYGCRHVYLRECDLKTVNIDNVNFEKTNILHLSNVGIFDKISLHPVFENLQISSLTKLYLVNCNIKEVSKAFIKMLPKTLQILDLSKNHIVFISKAIKKLHNLDKFLINENESLSSNGIPFNHLPKALHWLEFKNTNIAKIPKKIKRYFSLKHFVVTSKKLKYISWSNISPTTLHLEIGGGGKNKCHNLNLTQNDFLFNLIINNIGLEKIDCYKLPISLTHLSLTHNNIKEFDCKRALPCLQSLDLSYNQLTFIAFKNLSTSILNLNISHNYLKTIENISHLRNITTLNASQNELEGVDENIVNFEMLNQLYLQCNLITALPEGLENLKNLHSIHLSNNSFGINKNTNELKTKLWKRLPISVKHLYLSNNNIYELPCILKHFHVQSLHVEGCKLRSICPYFYRQWRENDVHVTLYISKNPDLTYFPFVPIDIYQPPPYDQKQENTIIFNPRFELITDMPLSQIKASQKFPRNPQKKPLYSLEHTPSENFLYDCQCCGICGTKTQEAIKQLMVMDFVIHFFDEKKYLEKKGFYDWTEDLGKTTYGEESKVYRPGKWKTEVKTKLCFSCQKLFKLQTDIAFERYKQKQNIDGLQSKKQKSYEVNRTLPQDMEVNGSPTAFYNQTSAAMCTSHSNTQNNGNDIAFNHLPPNQVLPNVAEFYHTQTKDLVKILGETPYILPICDVQENNSSGQSFTLESDSMPITREDPSLQSINEQQILLPSQSFEPSWPSCDQLTLQTLYPVEEDVTNVQETSINFPLHNSEDHLQFEPDIELNSRYNEDTTAQSFETSQANNQNYWSYPIEEVMESNNLARHYDHHIPENYNVPQTFVIYEIGQVEREGIQRFDYNLQFDERFQQNAASSYISAPKEQQQFPDQQSHVVMDQNLNMQMNEQHNVYDESLNDDHQIWEQYPTLYKL